MSGRSRTDRGRARRHPPRRFGAPSLAVASPAKEWLRAAAEIPPDGGNDDTNPSFQRTRGMRTPSALVPIFREALPSEEGARRMHHP